ncbi:MAG: hypothetical protein AAF216_09690 [Pseudomonadota bacterium]
MKKLLLATVAASAIALSAMAQDADPDTSKEDAKAAETAEAMLGEAEALLDEADEANDVAESASDVADESADISEDAAEIVEELPAAATDDSIEMMEEAVTGTTDRADGIIGFKSEDETVAAPAAEMSTVANASGRTVRYMTADEWADLQANGTVATTRTVTTTTSAPVSMNIRAAFQAMDSDADGAVSKREWASWQGRSTDYAPEFDGYDSDDDGALSLTEYNDTVS